MIGSEHSATATSPHRIAKPMYLSFVAAVALSSTLPNHSERANFRNIEKVDENVCSATAAFDLDFLCSDSASTRPKGFTHQEAADALQQLLAKNGIKPSRSEQTADGSILFQFLGKVRACVDLYPHGELIVVVRQSGRDEIHELQYEDSNRMIQLLRDAALAA